MKKILFVASFVMLLVFSLNTSVYAASAWDTFKTAMTGSEATVKLETTLVGEAEAITLTGTKTLNLNGKTLTLKGQLIVEGNLTITGAGKVFSDSLDEMIVVKPGATLTIDDAEIENTEYYAAAIQILGTTGKKTTVNINEDAEITANYPAYISKPGGQGITLNVKGKLNGLWTENDSKTESNGGQPLYINGFVTDTGSEAPVINIYDTAKLVADGDDAPAVYAAGYAVWNIYGGYFEGTEALSIKAGTFNIKGGQFFANGKYISPVTPEYNGSELSGSAISITSNKKYTAGKIELNIEYAEIYSENGYAILEVSTDMNAGEDTFVSKVAVEDGVFYGGKEAVFAENVDNFVTGGIYNTDVKDYVDSSLEMVEDKDNGAFFVGTPKSVNVANTKNGTVKVSFTEAIAGQLVTIKATPDEGYEVGTITVKDASGNKISVNKDGVFTMPSTAVTVSVTFKALALDDTPATGSIDEIVLLSSVIAFVAMAAIVTKRKVGDN